MEREINLNSIYLGLENSPSDSFSGVVCGASAYEVVVPAHGKAIVKTDLAVATPLDCYARIGIDYSLLCVY